MMVVAPINNHHRDLKKKEKENKEFVFVLTHSYDAIERAERGGLCAGKP